MLLEPYYDFSWKLKPGMIGRAPQMLLADEWETGTPQTEGEMTTIEDIPVTGMRDYQMMNSIQEDRDIP